MDPIFDKIKCYWDRRPCNSRHSKAIPGSYKFFSEVWKKKYTVEPHLSYFGEYWRWKDKKVLELGCGIGITAIHFAVAGAKVDAVDISRKSLSIARKSANSVLNVPIAFHLANIEKLSLAITPTPYDLVFSYGVIHHTPNPEKAIQEIKKFMREESVLKIMLYNRHSWKVFWIMIKYGWLHLFRLNETVRRHSEAQYGCPVTYSYTKNSVRKLLKDFDIQEMFITHIFPYKIRAYKENRLVKTWYFRWLPKRWFGWLESKIGWHICVTAKLKDGNC